MVSEFTHVSEPRAAAFFPAITLEVALYAAALAVALFVRFYALGIPPLNSIEARQALASYNLAQGNASTVAGNSLLLAAIALIFLLFTASDLTARLVPAFFGTALVLLPLFFRRDLGRTGAIVASALLAMSPALVFFSRTLDGANPAIVLGLAAYVWHERYRDSRVARDLYVAGTLAALALLTAAQAWFDGGVANGSFVDVLRLLLVYEPLIVLFGIGGFINVFLAPEKNRTTLFTVLASSSVVVIVLLAFSGDYNPARIVFLLVPLALMAGASIGAWLERLGESVQELGMSELFWHEIPILGICLAIISFLSIILAELTQRGNIVIADALARWLGSPQGNPVLGNVIVLLLFLLSFLATAFLTLSLLGTTRALNLGTVVSLTILSFWGLRQMAMLNFSEVGAYNPQEWIVARAASPNIRDLVRDLESQSRWRANDSRSLVIAADSSLGPILGWNLREFRFAQFSFRPSITPGIQALVTAADAPAPQGTWIAQKYQIEMTRGVDAGGRLRALIYRDAGLVDFTDAVLWVPKP